MIRRNGSVRMFDRTRGAASDRSRPVVLLVGEHSTAVLLVGTYNGKAGQYTTIQSTVNAAQPGSYILVAPGDYHEDDDAHVTKASLLSTGDHGGVVVRTPDLTIRGMNRDTVIVDGTKAGAPTPCSPEPQYQNFGPIVSGKAEGRNGIVVWKADDVRIENLTVCNFLGGAGDSGDGVGGMEATAPARSDSPATRQLPHGNELLLQRRNFRRRVRDL